MLTGAQGSISDQISSMFDRPVTAEDIQRTLNSPEYQEKCAQINAEFGLRMAMHDVMEAALGTDPKMDETHITLAAIHLNNSEQFEKSTDYHTVIDYMLRLAEQKPHLRNTVYWHILPDRMHLSDQDLHAEAVARNKQSAEKARQIEQKQHSAKYLKLDTI